MHNNPFSQANQSEVDDMTTQAQKNANGHRWYKNLADNMCHRAFGGSLGGGGNGRYASMKTNYDLVNNKLNLKDFEYILKPYGKEVGELPANFTNRDIISPKLKAIQGLELSRAFNYGVVATNDSALETRREFEFKMRKENLTKTLIAPIRAKIEQEKLAAMQGRPLSQEEQQKIQQEIEEELKSMTPQQITTFMGRTYKANHEIMAEQLVTGVSREIHLNDLFNRGIIHAVTAAIELYYIGEGSNGKTEVKVVNPLRVDFSKSNESLFIEESDWIVVEYVMTKSQVVTMFHDDLTNAEIKKIYRDDYSSFSNMTADVSDLKFMSFFTDDEGTGYNNALVKVSHCQKRSLRKVGFLTTINDNGFETEEVVDDTYKINYEAGDIKIEWKWIPEIHEVWKIGPDIYARMRPVPDQYTQDIFDVKLSYCGGVYDNTNSEPVSLVDRLKPYQYLYNIILYRIELLLAKDQGKILLMNIDALPRSAKMDTKKFMYFLKANNIAFYQTSQEGKRYDANAGSIGKEIDMSFAQNVSYYMDLANSIKLAAGESVGITPAMEGQIGKYEGKGNVQQSLAQSSLQLEPMFHMHNRIKANVLQRILEVTKTTILRQDTQFINYMTDDLTAMSLKIDVEALGENHHYLYVEDTHKANKIKETIERLTEVAVHSQKINLSAVAKVLQADGIASSEEILRQSEEEFAQQQALQAQSLEQLRLSGEEQKRAFEKEKWAHELEVVVVKERERRETEIQKTLILGMGFNEDKDADNDGMPDTFEVAKYGLEADLKTRKMDLDERKFAHQVEKDKKDHTLKLKAKSN